jgi:hypothetical protein
LMGSPQVEEGGGNEEAHIKLQTTINGNWKWICDIAAGYQISSSKKTSQHPQVSSLNFSANHFFKEYYGCFSSFAPSIKPWVDSGRVKKTLKVDFFVFWTKYSCFEGFKFKFYFFLFFCLYNNDEQPWTAADPGTPLTSTAARCYRLSLHSTLYTCICFFSISYFSSPKSI